MPRSRRSVPLLCVLCLVALTLCVHADAAFATEVLYAQVNTSILTYTVDVNSLEPTLVGSPLLLQGLPEFVQVVPSPNDHFLYILSGQQRGQVRMSVYATDASGVPQTPAVQILSPAPISQFAIDPNGRFAFAFEFQDFHRIGNTDDQQSSPGGGTNRSAGLSTHDESQEPDYPVHLRDADGVRRRGRLLAGSDRYVLVITAKEHLRYRQN